MSLSISELGKNPSVKFVIATERLCRTEDGRLVFEDDPTARWLFCVPGQKVEISEALKYGLIARMEQQAAAKQVAPKVEPETKEVQPADTKEVQPQKTKTKKPKK